MCSQFASVPWSSSADPASNVACSFISGAGEAVRGRALQTPGVFPSTGGLLSTSPGSQGLAPEPGRPLSGMAGPEPLPGRQGSGWSALMAPAPGTAPGPQRGRSAVCPSSDVKPGFYSGEMPGGGWERAPPQKFMSSQASGCDLFGSRVCKDLKRKSSWS